tara:strand:- start:48569 stop:50092 length:1524 start_codon:yes stop_codon:yes gene_type:complete
MIHFRIITFFLLFNIIYSIYDIKDSLIADNYQTDKRAILIPDYNIENSIFKIEFLNKRKKFFIDFNLGYLDQSNGTRLNISPILKYKRFNFKMNLDYIFGKDSTFYNNNWSDAFSIIERIEYLNVSLLNNQINLSLGEINDLSFGHGYLLNNYSNNNNYPVNRNLGLLFNYRNSNNSITYKLFISSIRHTIDSGGLIGNHISFLYSNSFPLRFGFSHIIDLDQFINYKDEISDITRTLNAYGLDFSFPLFNNSNQKLLFIGELSAIDIPEKRYYKRIDDNQFSNDKKSREGIWGIAFPGIKYVNDMFEIILAINYNSSIYSPYYFNSTYDFEKVRYRRYNIPENEYFYSDEAELLEYFSTSDSTIFLPKDMYSMINDYENIYPTYGFSGSLKFKVDMNNYFNFSYSYFQDIDNQNDSFFNSISLAYVLNRKIIFFPTSLKVFASKDFFKIAEQFSFDENMIYGLDVSSNLYKSFFLSGKLKHTFYDIDLDGSVDLVPYVNIGIIYKY